jgi:hypothetical protein
MEVVRPEFFTQCWVWSWLALKFCNENTQKTVVPWHHFASTTGEPSNPQLPVENIYNFFCHNQNND